MTNRCTPPQMNHKEAQRLAVRYDSASRRRGFATSLAHRRFAHTIDDCARWCQGSRPPTHTRIHPDDSTATRRPGVWWACSRGYWFHWDWLP